MAAVDIARITEDVASRLDQGSHLAFKVEINPANVISSPTSTLPATIEKEYFILNSQYFIDLQVYLKTAMKLLSTEQEFADLYPITMFQQDFGKDTKTPALYSALSEILVGINNRCTSFSSNTFGPMVSLAGSISNFSVDAASTSGILRQNLEFIMNAPPTMNKQDILDKIAEAQLACTELKEAAFSASTKCGKFVKAIVAFKDVTEADKTKLYEVTDRTGAVLPTLAEMNTDIRSTVAEATANLRELAVRTNVERDKTKTNSGVRWYYFLAWLGLDFCISDIVQKAEAEKKIREAQLRDMLCQLPYHFATVGVAIEKVAKALTEMIGTFSKLETDLDYISERFDLIKGYVASGEKVEQRSALVSGLAQQFQATGLIVEKKVSGNSELPSLKLAAMALDILGTSYRGIDYTDYSKILFNDGENLLVRSVEPGFPEEADPNPKSIAVLHQFADERRIFVCRQFTANHSLKVGPIQDSRDDASVCNVVNPYPKPAGAKAKILAITYGGIEVRDPAVYDYCYARLAAKEAIAWRNETFGGDSWPHVQNYGTIFYTVDGGERIQ
ncbi:hypothetical protein B0T22DRAFT_539346 [Podospora appendiculata]|uniref:Uncharacterized protein n=1 Tax=Podospora appendiculata TaxID=314037 RepID=A0AAE1C7V2_9PEZI|nr:hypothetical protein B0T22DRAFT_539346 [Podospora appendiculata]